jgi:hypothetical protein
MARRKNVKRIDPRYFLHETVNRGETIDEGVKDYIKSPALPSSIPYGSLAKVVLDNRDLLDIIKSDSVEPAVLAQKAQAFAKVGELLAQDVDIAPIAAKAGGVDNILDVRGFIKWADATGQFHRLGN